MATTETIPDPVCDTTACPDCGAGLTEGCRTPAGRRTRRTHDARVRAALTAAQAAAAPPATRLKDDLALQLTVLKVLLNRVKVVDADLRAQAGTEYAPGDQVPAYLTETDRKAGTNRLGRVGMSRPREEWKVTDPDKLAAWVAEHFPGEIETRPTVRNAFLGRLLDSCKTKGGWLLSTTGELLDVPGIECSTGTRGVLTVTLGEDADDLVAAALAEGRVRFDGERLAIEGGPA